MKKVWITKYALTTGIFSAQALLYAREDRMVDVGKQGMFFDSDWHLTHEEAIQQANKMKVKKIAAIRKQLVKLEKLNFD